MIQILLGHFLPSCMHYVFCFSNPSHGQKPSGIVDIDNVVGSFGSLKLKLGADGTFPQRATDSQGNNASSSGFNLRKKMTPTPKKIKNLCFQAQETYDKPQFCENPMTSGNTAADHDRILGFPPYFTTFVGESSISSEVQNHGQGSLKGTMDHKDWYSNSCGPQDFGAGTFYHCPPTPNFVNSSPFLCPDLRFRPMGQYTFENDRFREIRNTGLYSDNSQWNQDRGEALAESRPPSYLKWMQELLRWGDYQQKREVISVLEGCIFLLMTDRQINFLFPSLVDACEDDQLNSIVGDVLSDSDFFINAAFCSPGANSIVNLIRRPKKSHDHAFTMTQILSTRFLDIMTHPIARTVIRHYLIFFGTEPNMIFHEKAIDHFKFLAMHKVGCISLNDCINTISGEQKDMLLDKIAKVSDYLSNDPFGNFVVQNVLALRDMTVTSKILKCLEGQFVYLSQKKGGSHIVEICMESSYLGLECVVQEIIGTPKAALLLAQDEFGNYVVQKALKRTKILSFSDLHYSLVKCLEPYCREVNRSKGGRNIIYLLQ